jgi:hypothetical protein
MCLDLGFLQVSLYQLLSLTMQADALIPESITSGTPPPGLVLAPARYRSLTTGERQEGRKGPRFGRLISSP